MSRQTERQAEKEADSPGCWLDQAWKTNLFTTLTYVIAKVKQPTKTDTQPEWLPAEVEKHAEAASIGFCPRVTA